MTLVQLGKLFACLAITASSAVYAAESEEQKNFLPADSTHANWVFSGVVTSESGDNYGYFFQMQRDADQFHVLAALVDGQSKQVILLDESEATLHEPMPYNWHVGHSFLRFNPINDSWIFGIKTNDKKGFNFKVDMLNQAEPAPIIQALRPGVELLVNQTSHLNGHIQEGHDSKEQFVTAKNAWFRQVWLTAPQEKNHPFTGVFCRFNDGSGFYSVNMSEADALRGAVAGWADAQGTAAAMSQFINIKQAPEGPWHIQVASPSLHLILSDFIKQSSVVAGFVADVKTPGFCMLSKETIGIGEQKTA